VSERDDQRPPPEDEDPLFGSEGSVLFSQDPAGEPAPPPPPPPGQEPVEPLPPPAAAQPPPEAQPPPPVQPPPQPPPVWQQQAAPPPPPQPAPPPQPQPAPPPQAQPAPPPPPAPPPTPPSVGQQPGWQPPPYQPPPPRPRGPRGEFMFADRELASWGSRAGAWLLDLVAAWTPFWVGIVIAASSGADAADAVGGLVILVGLLWGYLLYAPLFMMRSGERNGQTLGKQVVGIRVIRDNGERMGFGYSLLREFVVRTLLLGVVGGFFLFPPFLDYLWPLWDETNRTLHDMVVDTHVVRADEEQPAGPLNAS
jgi:uncharacterized RDD family membrane protein YckC